MSWFIFYWSREDIALVEYWRSKRGRLIPVIDEMDCDADEYTGPPIVLNLTPNGNKRKSFTKGERNIILAIKGKICIRCNDGNTKILQIDHIDGNSTNNAIENLQLLCYVCHKAKHTLEALERNRSKI